MHSSSRTYSLNNLSVTDIDLESANQLARLKDSQKSEWPWLIKQKLRLCCIVHDFEDSRAVSKRWREGKQQVLLELCDALISRPDAFANEGVPHEVFRMFKANVLRPLPPRINPFGPEFDPEEDESVVEAQWPHLQLVYALFIRFLEQPFFDASLATRCVDASFVVRLMTLFNTEDVRERGCLQTLLHRIYGRCLGQRNFIREQLGQIFDEASQNGIQHCLRELLEVFASIANGFAQPLREEHLNFYWQHLTPLFRCRHYACFQSSHMRCILQFLDKQAPVAEGTLSFLLKNWPVPSSTRQIYFLGVIEEMLGVNREIDAEILRKVFRRIADCTCSLHFQIAERSLLMFATMSSGPLVRLLRLHQSLAYPIFVPILANRTRYHWHRNVQTLAIRCLHLLMDLNSPLYDDCLKNPPKQTTTWSSEFRKSLKSELLDEFVIFTRPQYANRPLLQDDSLVPTSEKLRKKSILVVRPRSHSPPV